MFCSFKMKCGIFLTVLLCFFQFVYSVGLFKCPRQPIMENFNVNKFMGRWYEIERSFNIVELTIKCLSVDIKRSKRGQIEIISTSANRWSGSKRYSEGVAVPGRRDASIYLYKTSSILPNQLKPAVGAYQIIDTDYTNYAVIWSCTNYSLFHRDFIWIWGRNREIDVNTRAKIYNFLTGRRIDTERLLISGSNNCSVV